MYLRRQKGKNRNPSNMSSSSNSNLVANLDWPSNEEEFDSLEFDTLDKDGWNLGSVQGFNVDADEIEVQLLEPLKTRAKDDQGRTYQIYSDNNQSDICKRNHALSLLPSVRLAKNT